MRFKVLRQHTGDKDYMPGDVREANENEVKHLVPHVLKKDDGKSSKNKAVKAENNKSA